MIKQLQILAFLVVISLLTVSYAVAQMGINSPAGSSPTQDLEFYSRNSFLVQQKYKYTTVDPTLSVNNLVCTTPAPNLTALAGILKEPTGDGNYSGRTSYSCVQSIQLPFNINPPYPIGLEIVFEDFDTEATDDKVIVTNALGNAQEFSGNTLPPRLTLPGGYAQIKFITDGDLNVGRGFRLRWRTLFPEITSNPMSIPISNALQFDITNGSLMSGAYNSATGYHAGTIGELNKSNGYCSTTFGAYNTVTGGWASAIGYYNTVNGDHSHSMGRLNEVSGEYATAIGKDNLSSDTGSISMGESNTASGYHGTAIGYGNQAKGEFSMGIGVSARALGDYSMAIGTRVSSGTHVGAFVLGDSDPIYVTLQSTAANQFSARFAGGYRLFSNSSANIGVQLAAGGNSWATISDSTRKEHFRPVDYPSLLRKIGSMRVGTWNYKDQQAHQRHYGPMAQDFYAAFGHDELGTIGCDTLLENHDFTAVTFAGVQGLIRENEALKKRIADLEKDRFDLAELRDRMRLLEKTVLNQRERVSLSKRKR